MAIGAPVNVGTAQDKTASASTSITLTAAVPVGALLVVGVAYNANGVIGSIVDSAGNTYAVDAVEVGSGVFSVPAVAIASAMNVAALSAGDTITVNWSTSPSAKALSACYVTGIWPASALDQTGAVTGSSSTPSVNTAGATTQADEITIGLVGVKGPSTDGFTQDATPAYANAPARVGTSGGLDGSNMTLNGGAFVESAAGSKTYNPTLGTSRAWAAVIGTYRGVTVVNTVDTLTPSLAEQAAPLVQVAPTDTATPALAEQAAPRVQVAPTDTLTPSLAEQAAPRVQVAPADTLTPSLAVQAAPVVQVAVGDTVQVSLADGASMVVAKIGFDVLTPSLTDVGWPELAGMQLRALTVRLTAVDGTPIGGATVYALRVRPGGALRTVISTQPVEAVTDAAGVAVLYLLPSFGDAYRIFATDAGGRALLNVAVLLNGDADLKDLPPVEGLTWH